MTGEAPLARRCPQCGEPSLVRDGDDERCTTEGCRYGVWKKYADE
jgi:ribosomal protein S27AE